MNDGKRSWLVLVGIVAAVSLASQWWWGEHDRSVGAQVAALARPGDIRMLGSQTCPVCEIARSWFDEHKIAYRECLIERDARCRADFDSGGYSGTPVIFVRGRPQLGFSPELIEQALAGRG
jgi:glutaredoxin